MNDKQKQNTPSLWHIIKTTFAAALGVQSDKNREIDFNNTSPIPYIIAGIIFTFIFMGSIILIVKFILQ